MMMRRKIVKHGNTSLTVSLPIDWVNKFNLKKGDEIEISEDEDRLVLSTERKMMHEKSEKDLSDLKDHEILSIITALYRQGYDEIDLTYNNPKQTNYIQDAVNNLLGLAIVEQTKKRCKIKDFSELKDDEFDTIMRRIFLLLIGMSEDLQEALKKKDKEGLSEMYNHDTNINKFCNLCIRILNKRGYKDHKKIKLLFHLIIELENIGDELVRLSIEVSEGNMKYTENFIKLYNHLHNLLREFYEFFYKYEKEVGKIREFYSYYYKFYPGYEEGQPDKISQEISRILKDKSKEDIIYSYYVRNSVNTIINLAESLLMIKS